MKFLSFVVNFLLAPVLIITGLLVLVDHTVSANYVESVLVRTNAYPTLTELLPAQIANMVGDGNDDAAQRQQTAAGLRAALTPGYLQSEVTGVLGQFEAVLKHGAPEVTIDLASVAVRARAAGLEVPADQFKPLVISADKLSKQIQVAHRLQIAEEAGLASSVVLLILSLMLGYMRGTYRALGATLAYAGVLVGLWVTALFIVPDRLLAGLHISGQVAVFEPLIRQLVGRVVMDLRLECGIAAGVALVLGVVFMALSRVLPGRRPVGPAPMVIAEAAETKPTAV